MSEIFPKELPSVIKNPRNAEINLFNGLKTQNLFYYSAHYSVLMNNMTIEADRKMVNVILSSQMKLWNIY